MTDMDARLQSEFIALCGIHESLGGLHPLGQPFGASLQLRVLPTPDLCLQDPCVFDVALGTDFPGGPPTVRCGTPWEHLPPRIQQAHAIDQMGGVKPRALRLLEGAGQEDDGWSRSYTVASIFYALRSLFLLPAREYAPWGWQPPPPAVAAKMATTAAAAAPGDGAAGGGRVPGVTAAAMNAIEQSSPGGGNGSGSFGKNNSAPGSRGFSVVVAEASDQGVRRTMEDVTVLQTRVALPALAIGRAAIYAIFDGHGGHRCAEHMAEVGLVSVSVRGSVRGGTIERRWAQRGSQAGSEQQILVSESRVSGRSVSREQ